VLLAVLSRAGTAAAQPPAPASEFLPDQTDSKVVTVTKNETPAAEIVIVTQAIVVKESGPKASIDRFGEVYSFSPAFIALHRDQPTEITLWNLQPDDQHDFALIGANQKIMMSLVLKPLSKTSYVFTFHRQGLFNFKCLEHQPAMNGQLLVMPPE
jgi:plastocyanin